MSQPIFIVGTGRCGSTMLSRMLVDHPTALSISELFSFNTDLGTKIPEAFPEAELAGEDFWGILGALYPKQNMLLKHELIMEEVIYPFDNPDSQFSTATGVPAVLQATLPLISSNPDALFEQWGRLVMEQPLTSVGNHYTLALGALTKLLGKTQWVERSGGSLRIVHRILNHFDNCKIVHLVRDGRNCALSMSKHIGFRMALMVLQQVEFLGLDPYDHPDRPDIDDLPEDAINVLPENFSKENFWAYDAPAALCGHYWSGEIIEGLRALQDVPAGRLLTIRFEDFFEQPEGTVMRLAQFINAEIDAREWVSHAARQIGQARSMWQALPLDEQSELIDATQPGFDALKDIGCTW